MITIRLRGLVLATSLLLVTWLLVAQTLGNTFLILPCLVCFLLFVAWTAMKKMVLPVLMFFLPFAALLKIQPGQTSFFTLALLVAYTVCLVLGYREIDIIHVIPAAVLIGFCLLIKTVYGYSLDNNFVLFAFSTIFAPYVATEFGKRYDFFWLTLFFTAGITVASISSLYLAEFASIARYIRYYELFGVVRHSGYYGDPNFYSAHISAAIAGVFVLLLNNTNKMKMIQLICMLMVLMYCGFLSVSKMFTLIVICLCLFFALEALFKKGKVSLKVLLFLTFGVGALFLVSLSTSSRLIEMILSRFDSNANLSDFTTGRTDIWAKFFSAFKQDASLLLFGQGYTDVMITSKASHNTIIQVIFQFGLVGCVAFVGWIVCLLRIYLKNVKIKWNYFAQVCLILLGTLGPWMALDMLFFDEMFLMPMYICIGFMSMSGQDVANIKKSRVLKLKFK